MNNPDGHGGMNSLREIEALAAHVRPPWPIPFSDCGNEMPRHASQV
jgi:hypothetical protein